MISHSFQPDAPTSMKMPAVESPAVTPCMQYMAYARNTTDQMARGKEATNAA
jgi:hypothetical protein